MICEKCGKEHNGSYGSGRFCSKECARSFSTKNDNKNILKIVKCTCCKKDVYINKRRSTINFKCDECKTKDKLKISKICKFSNISCEQCYFKINNICKNKKSIYLKFKTLEKYCNIKFSNDYNEYLKQYFNIKNYLQSLLDDGYSSNDLCNKLFGGTKKGNTVITFLQLHTRTLSESVINAFLQGKYNNLYDEQSKYKSCWHTSWTNKEYYLRSSYELEYAEQLDKQQILYEYENLHIKYFDTQRNKFRCAIPDFYLPNTNTIVEIKSNYTLNIQEMKDKVKSYKDLGYNFKLILDHKETDLFLL